MSPFARRSPFVVALLAAAPLFAAATPAGAQEAPGAEAAQVRSVTPVRHAGRTVTFRLRGIEPARIRSARLTAPRRSRRLRVGRVRAGARRGTLRVAVPRAWLPSGRGGARRLRALRLRLRLTLGAPAPPPASPESCAPAPGTFAAGNWPSGCWRPYSAESPFNQPLPASPRLVPNSAAIVRRLLGFGRVADLEAGQADTEDDWFHPTYWAQARDPVFTLHCTMPWGTCEVEGMEVRIPDRARPAEGGDAHLTVVDQASGWEYDFWQVTRKPAGGGRLEMSWGGRTRIDGDGLGSDATAAHFGLLAGIIRAQELEAGRIDHALFMVINCDSGSRVHPALGNGRACDDPRNAPPQGARFQLAYSDAEIDALAVPAWKKAILRALARYGAYVGDVGGSPWNFQFESGSTYTSFGQEDQTVAFARRIGAPTWTDSEGRRRYVFAMHDGVDWSRLRVVDPCVARRDC
jgi:hypothetical protein